ncbi:MAG TPA: AarF/UbiB family protein [Gemmatimonadaceae bacterium]|nr:AarF/UbiB family protein [Gemmatimonadaceae bacterium]
MLAPKHLPRLAATIGLFTRYGLADFAREQGLSALAQEEEKARRESNGEDVEATARAFREKLVELGPAYIKLGQVLATRGDLLPAAYIKELETLHDDVEPMAFHEVARLIEAELGAPLEELFPTINIDPLGTASLGQVHAATLPDGRDVVVKVQRPNIRPLLAEDIAFFHELAQFLTDHTEAGKRIDLLGILRQLERALTDELDYRVEARNGAQFRKRLAEFPRLLVPRIIEGYSTDKVLTTERIRGTKVSEIPASYRNDLDLAVLADELTRAYLHQIAVDGHFHADPHPGNIFLVLPTDSNPPTPAEVVTYAGGIEPIDGTSRIARAEREALELAPAAPTLLEPKLALIDFGMIAHLSPSLRDQCVRLLYGLSEDRGDEVADVLVEMGEPLGDFDRSAYQREINELVAQAYGADMSELEAGALLNKVITVSYQRGLRLPADLTLLSKTLVHLGGVTRSLDPAFEPSVAIRDNMAEIVAERMRSRLKPSVMFRALSEGADLLGTLPRRIDSITKRLADNELSTKLEVPQIDVLVEGLQKVANRVFTGLVLAALIVASAMLLPERRVLGTAGFIIAAALGFYMIGSILWNDRHARKPRASRS